MRKSKHSFAILAYKESPYLEECIISLKKQTVASDIFMATSTPSSFLDNLAEKYGIPVMINRSGNGIASDWSFAYNHASTPYVTLAHQDDIYLPEYTEQCLLAADQYGDGLLLFTDYSELMDSTMRSVSLNLTVKRAILFLSYLNRQNIGAVPKKKRMLAFGNPICCPSVMFHREKIGHFQFSPDFSYNLDWEAWLRLSQRQGDFIYVKKRLMIHRIHGGSALVKGTLSESRRGEDEALFRRFWPAPFARILSGIYSFLSYGSYLREKGKRSS